jgi:hypothetical protein
LSREFVLGLRDVFEIRSFVETGTYIGDTLAKLCADFDILESIELSRDYHELAVKRFAGEPNIRLVNADSTTGLEMVLGRLPAARALFWLDAHYSGGDTAKGESNTPITSELAVILANRERSDIILIDDLRYFWRAQPGFLQHEALLGYPSARDIVKLLNSGVHEYDCFALSDALLAIPSNLRPKYAASPLLMALTQSRQDLTNDARIAGTERLISAAEQPELSALLEIPDYLVGQSEYGLAGYYFYWRALVRLGRGEEALARADADIAARCGVIPDGSLLAGLGTVQEA